MATMTRTPQTGSYLNQDRKAISATRGLLANFRAFIRSQCTHMRDPYSSWGDTLTPEEAQRKLYHLVDVAINRKAGAACNGTSNPRPHDYLTGIEVGDMLRVVRNLRYSVHPDDQPYYGWFNARQRRVMRRLLGRERAHLVRLLARQQL